MPSFLTTRLRGEAPLETVFWRDMLLVGSAINIAAAVAAFAMAAAGYPEALAVALFFLPIPWNVFLLVANWRSAEREGGPPAVTARIVSTLWFCAMVVI